LPIPDSSNRRLFALFGIAVSPYLINGYINSLIADNPIHYWTFELVTWVVLPALVFTIARNRYGITLQELGFTAALFGKSRVPLLLGLCVAFSALDWYAYSSLHRYFSQLLPHEGIFHYSSVVPETGIWKILTAVYFAISAGFVEEAIYRGFAFRIMHRVNSSVLPFLVFSPLIFAAVHWESGLANVAASYVLGLIAAVAYVWLRNLWPLVVGHVFTDYVWFG
jgi:membrane protease YdiL (CAAX protease family)